MKFQRVHKRNDIEKMKIRRGHKGIVLLIEHVSIAFLGIRASHSHTEETYTVRY